MKGRLKALPAPLTATLIHTTNPFHPWKGQVVREIHLSRTIAQHVAEQRLMFDLPTLCLHNGSPVLRAEWAHTWVADGDTLAFVSLPQGGKKGSNPLSIVMMVAVVALAAFTGGAAAAAFGQTIMGMSTKMLVGSLVMMIGSQLVNMLVPPPSLPSARRLSQASTEVSPTYAIGSQGNSARLEQPIPVIYGTHRVYPDFAAVPYTEFQGQDQWLYQLFSVGLGLYHVDECLIEDETAATFGVQPGIDWVAYDPGVQVTLFPARVEVSVLVSGQELLQNAPIGPFAASSAGLSADKLGIDVVASRGMYYSNDQGGLNTRSATFKVEAAPLDAQGAEIGPFVVLGTETISGATVGPIRKTYHYTVATGRYTVKVTRTDAKDTSYRSGNEISWTGMRAYVPGIQTYPGTTVAVRVKASNNLSEQSSRRFNFRVRRKLSTWDGVSWSAPQATRSIAWALADACRAEYGGKLADSRVDIAGLYALEQTLNARNATLGGAAVGDYFDGVFDQRTTLWETLQTIARACRAIPIMQGGVIRFIRDQAQTLPTAMFTMRNIVQGTFQVEYVMPGPETADSVIVEWIDPSTLKPQEVVCTLPGSTDVTPARVKIMGVASRAHAWREGMYSAAANRFRRKIVTFTTEMEGHIPTAGDLIAVSHDMPSWGASGEVESVSALTLTLTEPLTLAQSGNYLALRRADGSAQVIGCGPATDGDARKVILSAAPDFTINPPGRERTHFAHGAATGAAYQLCRVLPPIRPRGDNLVEITAVVESSAVHAADTGTPPADTASNWNLPVKTARPQVTAINVVQGGSTTEPILNVSWQPAPGADHYAVDVSHDNNNWVRHADTTFTAIAIRPAVGPIWLRVAGVGLGRGDWVTWAGTAGQPARPGVVQNLAAVESFTGSSARIQWTGAERASTFQVEVWAAGVLQLTAVTTQPAYSINAEGLTRIGGPWREITFKVYGQSAVGLSDAPAVITLSNPQTAALSGVQVYAGTKSLVLTYTRPADLDWAGVRVHLRTAPGVPTDGTQLVYEGGDGVITLVKDAAGQPLVSGVPYYLKIGAYDSFGTDAIDYGVSEYSASPVVTAPPTPQEIKDGLQSALSDPASTALVQRADVFALELGAGNLKPFVVGTVAGQAAILLDANVRVQGTLSASQITGGQIAAGQRIDIGAGNIVLDGNGALIVYTGPAPASGMDTRDYAILNAGRMDFLRYRNGAYQNYKSVKRFEAGTAASGATVTLPGYWDAQPKVIVSANTLQAYNAAQGTQSQSWSVRASNLREPVSGSGVWAFDAIAELTYAASSGADVLDYDSGVISVDAWTSPTAALPASTAAFTVDVEFGSIRSTGAGGEYQLRAIAWTVHARRAATPLIFDAVSSRTRTLTAAEHGQTIRDSAAITPPAAGYYDAYYVNFAASDAGGTYTSGASQTETQTVQAASLAAQQTVQAASAYASVSHRPSLPAWSPPAGWTTQSVRYDFEYALAIMPYSNTGLQSTVTFDAAGAWWQQISPPPVPYQPWASKANGVVNGNPGFDLNYYPDSNDDWTAKSITATAYTQTPIQIAALNYGAASSQAKATLRNITATATITRPVPVSSVPQNWDTLASQTWNTAGGAAIATGVLNWLAVGE